MRILELARETKALAEKATPGPWITQEPGIGGDCPVVVTNGPKHPGTYVCEGNTADDGTAEKDCRFIAHTRTAAPQLADAVIELAEMLGWLLDNMDDTDGLWEEREQARELLTKLGVMTGGGE